jgi:dolichol-phosphate mannosyltransferase
MNFNESVKKSLKNSKLSIILPTYIECENVHRIYKKIIVNIEPFELDYEIIFVDDNSPDGTITAIKSLREKDARVKYILMSRRFGDQVSLMAGLEYARGDIVVIMDSDLQHPPRYIPMMIDQWLEGYDIVIMQRETEGHHSLFKKWTEILFYKLLGKLSDTPIFYRFSGFALMDRKVVKALMRFKERDPFLRGLVGLVGFRKSELYYKEDEREFGKSKYHLFDLFKLAITGITSFSDAPLYFSLYLGLSTVIVSLLYAMYVLISTLFTENSVQGWASTILVVIFIGGVQLISTGILGIFLSKVFVETKRRPKYIMAESAGFEGDRKN